MNPRKVARRIEEKTTGKTKQADNVFINLPETVSNIEVVTIAKHTFGKSSIKDHTTLFFLRGDSFFTCDRKVVNDIKP